MNEVSQKTEHPVYSDSIGLTDAYSPKEMAYKAQVSGVAKANLDFATTFVLAVLAGAFIAFGACLYTTAITGLNVGFGLTRLIGGVSFSLGLILVIVTGAELFTGNTLMVIAYVSGKISFLRLMRNWAIVYFGNIVGSLAVVFMVFYAQQWKMGEMAVGVSAYNIAGSKLSISPLAALISGILCNILVCLAIWLCYSARTTTDKILSVLFPVSAFVALGFEHSIANMYFMAYGMLLSNTSSFMRASVGDYAQSVFTIKNLIINNLIPVTCGNIIGGAFLGGIIYWIIYLRQSGNKSSL